jgi:folate-binding protein YgfZ
MSALPTPPSLPSSDAAGDGMLRLPHWGLMRAQGSEARSFLHGQLTNDVASLTPNALRLAGFCSAKGRLQASFQLWQHTEDELLLACHASVLPATLKRLSMFVLRSKCKLSDAGAAGLVASGLVGSSARSALVAAGMSNPWTQAPLDGGDLLCLPPVAGLARAVWVAPADAVLSTAKGAPALAESTWHRLELLSGLPVVEAATVDQFVPQMLNYELVGGVDFRKGCYPGQEVVARSQYRGTVKRRMFLFEVAALAAPGQEVFHSADPGQPAGMVVNAAEGLALVEVKLAALGNGSLHLGAIDGPLLAQRDLPYPVPTDALADA